MALRRKILLTRQEMLLTAKALRFYREHHPNEAREALDLAVTVEVIEEAYEETEGLKTTS